jgi:hypothetical protein
MRGRDFDSNFKTEKVKKSEKKLKIKKVKSTNITKDFA